MAHRLKDRIIKFDGPWDQQSWVFRLVRHLVLRFGRCRLWRISFDWGVIDVVVVFGKSFGREWGVYF